MRSSIKVELGVRRRELGRLELMDRAEYDGVRKRVRVDRGDD